MLHTGFFSPYVARRSIRAFGFGYCPEGNTPSRLRYCLVGNTRSFCGGETFMSHSLSWQWGMKNPTHVEKRRTGAKLPQIVDRQGLWISVE